MVRLAVSKKVEELIQKMHPDLKKSIRASLGVILAEPDSGKPLVEELSGLRSFRVKTFRIIYRIKKPETIEIVAIGPRERIYEETFRLIRKEKAERLKNSAPSRGSDEAGNGENPPARPF